MTKTAYWEIDRDNWYFFLIPSMVLSSSQSTAYLLTVVPHRIDRAFDSSGATQAVTLDT